MSFFSLPSEIRNIIYQQTLISPVSIQPLLWRKQADIAGALMSVSRALNLEATPYFYMNNTFDLSLLDVHRLEQFFAQIGTSNANMIEQLSIGFPSFVVVEEDNANCTNLAHLTLRVSESAGSYLCNYHLDHELAVERAFASIAPLFQQFPSHVQITVEYENDPHRALGRFAYSWTNHLHQLVMENWGTNVKRRTDDTDDEDEDFDIPSRPGSPIDTNQAHRRFLYPHQAIPMSESDSDGSVSNFERDWQHVLDAALEENPWLDEEEAV